MIAAKRLFTSPKCAFVAKNLWIGPITACENDDFFIDSEIKLVINASKCPVTNNVGVPTLTVEDYDDVDMAGREMNAISIEYMFRLERIVRDIAEQVRDFQGDIFVHCKCGINRSALIIGGILVLCHGYTADEAMAAIKTANKRRSIITLSNRSFVFVLQALACNL